MKLPAIILVRAGSKRLPDKWKLPWRGTTLLRWAVAQCIKCENVSRVIVGTDSQDIIDHVHGVCKARVPEDGRDYAPLDHLRQLDIFKDSVSDVLTFGSVKCVRRDPVSDDQPSLQGVRDVQALCSLDASYCLLVQCTSPFVNPADLSRLVLCADLPSDHVACLSRKQRPTGMGYIIPPFIVDATPRTTVEQDAQDVDVDTQADYERALQLCQP